MREPNAENRIQAPSIPEIKEGIVASAMRLGRSIKFRGRKLRPGPLINAVMLQFLTMPAADQERLAREYLARYEAILEHDDVQSLDVDPPGVCHVASVAVLDLTRDSHTKDKPVANRSRVPKRRS